MYNQVRQLCAAGISETTKTYNMKTGRPTKYDPRLIEKVDEYLEDRTPTLHTRYGFANFIGVDEDTLVEWDKKYKEFSVATKRIADIQKEELLTKGLAGKYNPTMSIFVLKANHGMIETEKRILAGDKNDPITIEIVEQAKE